MPQERWKPVAGYERNYEVSDYGDVRQLVPLEGLPAGYHPFQLGEKGGRRMVSLVQYDQREVHFVDELVARAFIGAPNENQVVWHRDSDFLNNHIDNLEYIDRSELAALHIDYDVYDDFDDFGDEEEVERNEDE
ncbi:MAG TPA: NUMOD4 domain-containing protein [Aggregatilineales bacterium]|nr:NUMOD4 domain-containing protein [Aggregatilineales bacterium]